MAVLSPSARAAALDVESRRIGEQFATLRSHAESYDVDLRAILGRASAQANIIHSGDQTESPAPPPGPSPRPSPAAQPPPAATGGPQTSQEHQQTLLDAKARVLDGAAPVGCTVGGSEYTTPAARPPPPVRAAALGEAACQFVSPHAAPPLWRALWRRMSHWVEDCSSVLRAIHWDPNRHAPTQRTQRARVRRMRRQRCRVPLLESSRPTRWRSWWASSRRRYSTAPTSTTVQPPHALTSWATSPPARLVGPGQSH